MNKENIENIKTLDKSQYRKFLQRLLGMYSFLNRREDKKLYITEYPEAISVINKNSELYNKNNKKSFLKKNSLDEKCNPFMYVLNNDKTRIIYIYWYSDSDRKELLYRDQNNKEYSIIEQYSDLNDDLIYMIIRVAKGDFSLHNVGDYPVHKQIDKLLNIKNEKFEQIYDEKFDFVLGTGVVKELGVTDWEDLVNRMNDCICEEKKILLIQKDEYEKFVGNLGYKYYSIPQILKNTNEELYFSIIYDSLYANFGITKINDREIENTTLYQVAKILFNRQDTCKNQNVLTFNYDNYLEMLLKRFDKRMNFTYKYKGKNRNVDKPISIIHSHGYLPYSNKMKKRHKDSIILSNFEYMDNYQNKSNFAYKQLFNQLDSVNMFVGNSVSDYQEQFVLREHIKAYPSKYSLLLCLKSDIDWINYSKALYFYDLGLISLYFNNISEIKDFLANIARKYEWSSLD